VAYPNYILTVVAHAEASRVGRFFSGVCVCLSVSLSLFPRRYLTNYCS